MIIVTTLVIPVGGDAGPFDLYTDSDGYAVPFATNVSAATLEAGYSSTVPNDATIVRVVSVGTCTNFINLDITLLPPTTTTTSSSSSTSTSTSTTTAVPATTTTTTTLALLSYCYEALYECPDPVHDPEVNAWVVYTDQFGNSQFFLIGCDPCTCIESSSPPVTNDVVPCTPSPCNNVEVYPPIFNPGTFHIVEYLDCSLNPQTVSIPDGGTMVTICATSIVSDNGNGITYPLFTICF